MAFFNKSHYETMLRRDRMRKDKNKRKKVKGIRSETQEYCVHSGWTVKGTDFPVEKFPKELRDEMTSLPTFYSTVNYRTGDALSWFKKNKEAEKMAIASARGYYLKKWGSKDNTVCVLLAAIDGKYQYIVIKNTTNQLPYSIKASAKRGTFGMLRQFDNNITFMMRPYGLIGTYYIEDGERIHLPQKFTI